MRRSSIATPVAERMEDRILHSADLLPAAGLDSAGWGVAQQQSLGAQTAPGGQQLQRNEIVFVDGALSDRATLLADLRQQQAGGRPIEIVEIGAGVDGLALIGQTLAGRSGVAAVHILSHGSDGVLQLGTARIDAATLLQRADEVADWGNALTADADLLLYGCDLAETAIGQRLVQDLAALTGADVAASTDATGVGSVGGNWVLELQTGTIETAVVISLQAQTQWLGLMAPQTFVVNSTVDVVGATLLPGTLRWAISQANANPGTDTIVFAVDGTFNIVSGVSGDDSNATGDFDITGSVNIVGNGTGKTIINGNGVDRVFDIRSGSVSFSGLTIQGGASNSGGGLRINNQSSVTLTDVVVQNNVGKGSTQGAGIYTDGGLTLRNVIVQNNGDTTSGNTDGGGIYADGTAVLNARDVEIRNNMAWSDKDGGGLYVKSGASVTLENVTFAANQAKRGGGVWNDSNFTKLSNVTLSGNTATSEGGGIWASRSVTLEHVTVASNAAPVGKGGGVYDNGGKITTLSSLFAGNTGGNANVALQSQGYNLSDDGSAGFLGTGDKKGVAAGLSALAANGGFTRTHAISESSTARNSAAPQTTLLADQRGAAYQGRPDIGAYEYNQGFSAPTLSAITDKWVDEDASIIVAFTIGDAETLPENLLVSVSSGNLALLPNAGIVLGGSGANRTVTLTPAANANSTLSGGPVTVTVSVSDGSNVTQRSFTLTVVAQPDAPVAVDDSASTPSNTQVVVSVLANDYDVDGDALVVQSAWIVDGANGSVSFNSNSITYTPSPSAAGPVLIRYTAFDGGLSSNVASLTVNVGPNNPPTGSNGLRVMDEDTVAIITAADLGYSDPDSHVLGGVRIETLPLQGTLRLDGVALTGAGLVLSAADLAAGRLSFAPAADANGVSYADFRFRVQDSQGAFSLAASTLTFNVTPVADAPRPLNDSASTPINQSVTVTVLDNDSHPDGLPLVLQAVSLDDPAQGTVSIVSSPDPRGAVRFTPSLNLSGPVTIRYTVGDGAAQANATLTVTVGANTLPTSADRRVAMAEDATYVVAPGDIVFSDVDASQFMVDLRIEQLPGLGSLTIAGLAAQAGDVVTTAQLAGGSLVYRPTADGNGVGYAGFRFSVGDSAGGHSGAYDFVFDVDPVNDAPVAAGSATLAAVDEDTLAPAGATVASLFAGNYSDAADAGNPAHNQLAGVAVRGGVIDLAQGRWQYSLDAGVSWLNVGTVTDGSALALGVSDRLRFQPAPDFNGVPDPLSVRLIDNSTTVTGGSLLDVSGHGGSSAFSTATVSLATGVNPVNDAPVITAPATLTVTEDLASPLTGISFADIDADAGTVRANFSVDRGSLQAISGSGVVVTGAGSTSLGLTGTLDDINAFIAGSGVSYRTEVDDVADMLLTVAIDDGGNTGSGGALGASTTVTLRVTAVNDAPTLATPIADQSATQNAPFSFTVPAGSFNDVDAGDMLSYSATLASGAALPGWLSFDAATRTFSGTPANADVGSLVVRVTATDLAGESAAGDFTLAVANVNDAPTLATPIADQSATQDVPFSFTVPAGSFNDIDVGDVLSYSATLAGGAALPGWLSFDAATRTFSGTPANADVGSLVARVTATDLAGESAAGDFTLAVANVNDAPTLAAPIAGQSATQGQVFNFTVPAGSFADIDVGDVLSYSASLAGGAALPGWLSFDAATRTFSGTPANADVGSLVVRVTATDLAGESAAGDFTLAVANVNDAPTLATPIADQSATQDGPFSFTVPAGSFNDVDVGDVLSYSATLAGGAALPGWLSFDAATRTFSGTPANADVGSLVVRVTATDLAGESAAGDFTLAVANVNDAPTLATPIADQSATQDGPFSFTVPAGSFNDVDVGDVLSYSATLAGGAALPGWLSFDAATRTFSGTPANADVGSLVVRVTATDLAGESAAGDFTLAVANVNDAPTLATPIADQSATQDGPFSFTVPAGSFNDVDVGDVLSYSATLAGGAALPGWLSFDAITRTFSGTPANADVGSIIVRVTATDLDGASADGDFTLAVANVNDAPVLATPIADQLATQDAPFSFTVPAGSFNDIDVGDVLSYSATLAGGGTLPGWLSFDAATRTFIGTPGNADVGSISVWVTATDLAGASAAGDFTLAVANVNDAPTLVAPIADQSATQDAPFSFTVPAGSFTDVDAGDVLSYSATLGGGALPGWLSFDAETRTFSGTPANADVGSIIVRVTATDLAGESAAGDFTLAVANVNDAPVLATPIADQSATQDAPFSFTVPAGSFTDIDVGDVLSYSASLSSGAALPAWLGFDAAARTFSGTPANADVGSLVVRVTATDLAGESAAGDFTLAVANVNDAPTLVAPIADQSATQDAPFSFTVPAGSFTDVDAGDVLSYSATLGGGALPGWLSFDAETRTFSGTPANADVGSIIVRVTATDLAGESAAGDFTLAVANVNDAPVLATPIADQSATQDATFSFTVPAGSFTDIDVGDVRSYSASLSSGAALPAWLGFDAAARTFSGTPANADVGSLVVRVTATDLAGDSAAGDFTLAVANVNDAPTLATPIAGQSATQDAPFSFTVPAGNFTDVDAGDVLSYSATLGGGALPGWLSFDAETRTFSGTPANANVGNISVRVTATDLAGASADGDFTLAVANVNDAPTLATPIAGQSATQDAPFSFTVPAGSFNDIDVGDVLSYSATLAGGAALPGWLSFDAITRTFSGTPANADVGSIIVRVTATDLAGASAAGDFTLAVANVNDAPVLATPIADQSATQDAPFSFTVPAGSFTDVDAGDVLSYSASLSSGTALPGWLKFDAATRTFSSTPGNADVGTIALRVTATDTAGASGYGDFMLTVANVNDAPALGTPIATQSATQGQVFGFTVPAGSFVDADAGDVLSYSASLSSGAALPGWLSFDDATRTFSGTPGNADVGSIGLRVTATDLDGAGASGDFRLTVANVNDAPTLSEPLANQSATQDHPFSFTVPAGSFTDIDAGDMLTYSAKLASGTGLPGWLSFDALTRTFSGTPGNADVGSISLRVTATDTAGASAYGNFVLNVANVNDAPRVASPVGDRQAVEGTHFSFSIPPGTFVDVDAGDRLQLSATRADGTALPGWLVFEADAARFAGTPMAADIGRLVLRMTATDAAGASVQTDLVLVVAARPQWLSPPAIELAAAVPAAPVTAAPGNPAGEKDPQPAATTTAAPARADAVAGAGQAVGPLAAAPDAVSTPGAGDAGRNAVSIEIKLPSRVSGPAVAAQDVALVADSTELKLAPMLRMFSQDDMFRRFDGDQLQRRLLEHDDLRGTLMASSTVAASSLSIGYVVWLVRGGVLMSSMLSALPAWQMMDPLPVVAARGAVRGGGAGGDAEADDDVERLFDDHGRRPRSVPTLDDPPDPAAAPGGNKETS